MRLPLVIGGIPIIPIDFSEPPLIIAMRALSLLGTIPVIFTATLALAFVLFWRRRRKALVLLLLIVCGGEVIGLLLKWLFAEPFLPWTNPLLIYSKASFPSGHAMRSVLFFGCLTYFLMRRFSSWRGRLSALFAGTGLVLSIGASRVYL